MSLSKENKKAVALKYRTDKDAAPVIIASGYGDIAEGIINIAEKQGIPVYRDDSAASLLCMLDVGASIPPELYQVVAEIYCKILMIASQNNEKTPAEGRLAKTLKEIRGNQT